jgi:SAM-dependent methyltransferase
MVVTPLPWDFGGIVAERVRAAECLLDLGTGGGEWLAALPARAPRTVATESWPPNVPVARKRLERLGIEVVQTEPARDTVDQGPAEDSGKLPFGEGSFDLVTSRHEAFVAAEVSRVLRSGGRFLTEQLGPGCDSFERLLGLPARDSGGFMLDLAARQLKAAGFDLVEAAEGEQHICFGDVGALAWYLKAVPWTVPGFTPRRAEPNLRRLHESNDPLEATLYGFWIEAIVRPCAP